MKNLKTLRFYLLTLTSLLIFSCSKSEHNKAPQQSIRIDGSSTTYPITEAVAEEFSKENPRIQVQVGVSGTGGGFKKFINSETAINNASRKIKNSEKEKATANGIQFSEVPIAYDGITFVVNNENTWAQDMTVDELNRIWKANSTVTKWSDIRPEWPEEKIKLFGPGTESGTYDYFCETILGKNIASRSDYLASEDDNILVHGIRGEKFSLGFFGFAYYQENKTELKALSIDGVLPSLASIQSGRYKPLSRPLYIYINKASLKSAHIKNFVHFFLDHSVKLVQDTGYIPLELKNYQELKRSL